MMKFARGLYLFTCYAVGLPILLVFLLIGGVYSIIKLKIEGYDLGTMEDFKEYAGAIWYGVKEGHKINMHFVKYGRNGYEHLNELTGGL